MLAQPSVEINFEFVWPGKSNTVLVLRESYFCLTQNHFQIYKQYREYKSSHEMKQLVHSLPSKLVTS